MCDVRRRILVVEDDRDLLELTSAILGQEHHIICESETAPGLRRIAAEPIDLLITDLSIESAGDGLLLAGAMRYLQPQAQTVMITGFPDFTRAVLAMQTSLDLVLLKPVGIDELRKLPGEVGSRAGHRRHEVGHTSIFSMLESKKTEILSAWLHMVEHDIDLAQVSLSSVDRLDHMEAIVTDLAHAGGLASAEHAAHEHGHERQMQNYRAEWVAKEISFLRRAIFDAVLRELLHLDLSNLANQIFVVNNALDIDLLRSLRSFGLLTQ
ncbi:MAG: response regulator [Terriglobales bacterium]